MVLLSRLSLANKSIITLIALGIMLAGVLLIPQLNQEALPPITLPVISILTPDPGASPDVVERDVTNPLEQSLKSLQGVKSMSSRTANGLSGITLQYDYGTDMEKVQQEVTQRVNNAKSSLPAGVTPQIQVSSFNSLSMMEIAITSDQDQLTLANGLQQKVLPYIQGITGVANVRLRGVNDQVVSIKLDTQKMQDAGITLDQLSVVLAANNMVLPAGTLNEPQKDAPVRVGNTFTSTAQLEKLVVGAKKGAAGPQPVKLSDIATVTLEQKSTNLIARTNGKPSLDISVFKTDNGNTVAISRAVHERIATWEKDLGYNTKFVIIGDEADTIASSIDGLRNEGLLGAAFAILITLVFLFSVRSTLITAISIPLSVLIALIAMKMQDFSLNIMTLAGLTISIGRVIDDSIVVLENIHRHLHLGEEKRIAVISAVKEVAGAVTASTLTTVTVFLPLGFAGGFVSVYFKSFSITVAIALIASLLVSLTIIPVLAYWFMKAPRKSHQGSLNGGYKPSLMERGYAPLVGWVTRHSIITIGLSLLLLIGVGILVPMLPTNLLDTSNQNQFQVAQILPAGTNLQNISAAGKKVEDVLASFPEIQSYMISTSSGSYSLAGNGDVENDAFVTTDPNINQPEFQKRLQAKLDQVTDAGKISVNGSNTQNNTVQFQVQAPNNQALEAGANQVLDAVKGVADTTNVKSDLAGAVPLIDVRVDPAKAGTYGLSAAQINMYVRMMFDGVTATQLTLNDTKLDVDLRLNKTIKSVEDVSNIKIPTLTGQAVRLADVATVDEVLQPPIIAHLNGNRTATISIEVTGKSFGATSQELQRRVDALKLPDGVTVSQGGAGQQFSDAFSGLYISLGVAILLVFIVMVATFRSLLQPLILLVAIPFAGVGSILLMFVTGTALGLPAMIGLLMLIGIVVTNAIVLIDRVNQFREAGHGIRSAVVLGATQRLRPILMTALATIFALIPMAIGLSPSGLFISRPLSIVVIGGLSSSTLLTLLLVPTLYVAVESMRERLSKKEQQVEIVEERDELSAVVTAVTGKLN